MLLLQATSAVHSPGLLVIAFAVLVMLSRIVLPSRPAMLLLSLALVPAAPALGISAWVAGFVVLVRRALTVVRLAPSRQRSRSGSLWAS